jgi:hypothetical protein
MLIVGVRKLTPTYEIAPLLANGVFSDSLLDHARPRPTGTHPTAPQ